MDTAGVRVVRALKPPPQRLDPVFSHAMPTRVSPLTAKGAARAATTADNVDYKRRLKERAKKERSEQREWKRTLKQFLMNGKRQRRKLEGQKSHSLYHDIAGGQEQED